MKNICPIEKNEAMVRIFAQAFDFGNIFSKSKTNVDEDKKENFRIEVVKQGLVFAAIRYAVLKFTYH